MMDLFDVVRKLKTISQAGRTFAKDDYELKRHLDIEEICADILADCTGCDAKEALHILQQDTGYPTPKVDCRGVIIRDDKVLLVKEIEDGRWTLPGGWCDNGMTPSENVEREIWEESGYEAKAQRLLAVYDRDKQGHFPPYPFNIYKLFFLCEITGGSPKPSNETSEIAWFGEDEIPELSKARTTEQQLRQFFEMVREDDRTAYFD
ncbi:MAG: NUDIX hydrolase N-terminal domain-containing protein [Phycisphaerae bacterium]|jgi:ADP-ribose pyrophosphatase YjhB (NUDIX family)